MLPTSSAPPPGRAENAIDSRLVTASPVKTPRIFADLYRLDPQRYRWRDGRFFSALHSNKPVGPVLSALGRLEALAIPTTKTNINAARASSASHFFIAVPPPKLELA